jgi:hypothetical protein
VKLERLGQYRDSTRAYLLLALHLERIALRCVQATAEHNRYYKEVFAFKLYVFKVPVPRVCKLVDVSLLTVTESTKHCSRDYLPQPNCMP